MNLQFLHNRMAQQSWTLLLGLALLSSISPLCSADDTKKKKDGKNDTLVSRSTAEKAAAKEVMVDEKDLDKPQIDVVFVLDTTGSMSGLIAAAQDKIWAIASTFTQAQSTPTIRMGLVGYRDRGDAYVTKITPLTKDIDKIYSDLMAFKAAGGGDGPESVNQALHEAVTKMGWHKGKKTHRVIYLVGDAPPHMDYDQDVRYAVSCKKANKKDIIVNTIQCGSMSSTRPIWQEIAQLGDGKYLQIAQSGGQIVRITPYDVKIQKLNIQLEATRRYYGSAEIRLQQEARTEMLGADAAKSLPASALARRAKFNVSGGGMANFLGRNELVDAYTNGTVDLKSMKDEELPKEFRSLSVTQRETKLKELAARRTALQAEIKKLADQRQAFIVKELAAQKGPKNLLDDKLFETLKEQAAGKGFGGFGGGASY